MTPNREMIDAFVDGRLSAADHDLMVHHISSCTECAAAVIGALAEAARALAAEASERPPAWTSNGAHDTAVAGGDEPPTEPSDLLQLDFTLDHAAEPVDLLLPRETVQEVQLDELYPPSEEFRSPDEPIVSDTIPIVREQPAVVQVVEAEPVASAPDASEREITVTAAIESERPAEPRLEKTAEPGTEAGVESVAEPEGAAPAPSGEALVQGTDTLADVAIADEDSEIKTATAAGVAASVAHAAAALAEHAWKDDPREAEPADVQVPTPPTVEESPPAPLDERIPDDARAAIVSSVRADADLETLPRRSGLSAAAVAIVALMVFAGLGAYAAVQLRAFAGTDSRSASAAPASAPSQPAASVLGPVLDSAAYAGVVDFPDSLIAAADSLAANQATESAGPPALVAQRRAAAVMSGDATPPSQRTPGSRSARGPSRGITPAPTGGLVPRLLRTTTHQRGNVYLVLREYDADSPAPGSRPGVNEYRWTNETLTRLFVLSGPVQVAELRAFARALQTRPAP